MKTFWNICTIAGLLLLMGACSKEALDQVTKEHSNEYELKFTASGVHTSTEPITKSSTKKPVTQNLDLITTMNFFIYTAENELIRSYMQKKSDSTFGMIDIQLTEGDYKIGIVAYTDAPYLDILDNGIYHALNFTPDYDHPVLSLGNTNEEIYSIGYHNFTVSNDSVYSPLELKRLNSHFELEITDEIPADADFLIVDITQGTNVQLFRDDDLSPAFETMQNYFELSDLRGQSGTKFPVIVYPQHKSGWNTEVRARVYDTNRDLIADLRINDVQFKSNYRTNASGQLFAGVEGVGLSTTLIEDYDGEIPIEY